MGAVVFILWLRTNGGSGFYLMVTGLMGAVVFILWLRTNGVNGFYFLVTD